MRTEPVDRVAQTVASIKGLTPLVSERRAAFDRDRRLPVEVFTVLAEAGLFRLWLPQSLGGPGFSPLEFMEIVEAASALDGTVGWLVGNGGGMSRAAGHLPEHVARGWFSDPHAFIVAATGAVGSAKPCDGGFRLSGRWPFASGAHHGTRFMGHASVQDGRGDGPPLCCFVARDDVRIDDNWHVSGLRGTGSCDFEVDDVFVPVAHTYSLGELPRTQPGIVYRLPWLSAFIWSVSVVPLGIARGVMDAFAAIAQTRMRAGTALRDRETVQMAMGRAEALHGAGRAFLIDAMKDLMAALDDVDERLTNARIRFRLACAHAAETALRIVDLLAAEAGTASIMESGTIERSVRDLDAATKHIAMSANSYAIAGRHALGLDPGPRF
jgi:alkylation response protein AidB-like acyl-CoA dehydrogenase